MKCIACGRDGLMSGRENHQYDDVGLVAATLVNVQIRRCPNCGETEVTVPNLEALDRTIALALIVRPGTLLPTDVVFLRKHLGLTSKQLADTVGVDKATVSRWERGHIAMPLPADRLIRSLVRELEPVPGWGLATFPRLVEVGLEPWALRLEYLAGAWRKAAA